MIGRDRNATQGSFKLKRELLVHITGNNRSVVGFRHNLVSIKQWSFGMVQGRGKKLCDLGEILQATHGPAVVLSTDNL